MRENIEDLNGRVGANDTDLIFLKGLMDSPIMRSLVKVRKDQPVSPEASIRNTFATLCRIVLNSVNHAFKCGTLLCELNLRI